jgi:hypothetical protein
MIVAQAVSCLRMATAAQSAIRNFTEYSRKLTLSRLPRTDPCCSASPQKAIQPVPRDLADGTMAGAILRGEPPFMRRPADQKEAILRSRRDRGPAGQVPRMQGRGSL